ncbi:MAG: hypothetical protein ABR576_13140 [Thermoanaerobaculia bacterium]
MSASAFRRTGLLTALLAFAAAAFAAPPAPPKGTVRGTLTLDGKKIELKHAAAYTYDSVVAPGKKNVSILLSDKPVSEKAFQENFFWRPGEPLVPGLFEGVWKTIHMEGGLQGVAISFYPDQKPMGAAVLVGGQEGMFDLMGSDFVAEVKSISPRVVGKVRTATSPMEAGDHKLSLDASFDLPATNLK